ncbi:hypothetical protein QYF61_003816 [Mycteria americana]|uniref:Uncharacterized protein n=1 Tax=Mycteria americana TaxID=33587 RepID=A0AAN7NN39_MYCAM|nr:hypothetical protein QYF61_003816 [Mycteria americana]
MRSNMPCSLMGPVVFKKLGGGTARTADPNCPEGYSIPYGVMLSIETGGIGRGAATTARELAGYRLAGARSQKIQHSLNTDVSKSVPANGCSDRTCSSPLWLRALINHSEERSRAGMAAQCGSTSPGVLKRVLLPAAGRRWGMHAPDIIAWFGPSKKFDQTTEARSYVRKCPAALFAQVDVTQHGLYLVTLQELQQAQNSPVQANLSALLLVSPKLLLPMFSC